MAVSAALLDAGPGSDDPVHDVVEVASRLAMLRVELTNIVAPATDHIAWTRLGEGYRPGDAERALAAGRLWERGWMLRPPSQLGLFLAGMRTWAERSGTERWMEANEPFARGILDRIADLGPLTSRDVPDEAVVPWPSRGWTNNRNVTQMLECLHMSGRLAVVGRAGRLRIWDLAERVLPPVEEVPLVHAHRIRSEHLLRAFGVTREATAIVPNELHNVDLVGVPVEIEGVRGRWRADPVQVERRDEPFAGRTVILSPFDRLLSDRVRVAELFQYDYALEMYQPKGTRRWGAFALPILHGDRLVGKVDARADRTRGTLHVAAIHEDEAFTPMMTGAVDDQLAALAGWLRLRATRE